jgi:hypothetical protein
MVRLKNEPAIDIDVAGSVSRVPAYETLLHPYAEGFSSATEQEIIRLKVARLFPVLAVVRIGDRSAAGKSRKYVTRKL